MSRPNRLAWFRHGYSGSSTYNIWVAMKQRCKNPNNPNYHKYGGRGITVCKGWNTSNAFDNFLADMGEHPVGLSLERIDNAKGYWCGHCDECIKKGRIANCRWATPLEQSSNTRHNVNVSYEGRTQPLKAWAREFNLDYGTLRNRLRKGWPLRDALTLPASQVDYVYNLRIIEFAGKRQCVTAWAKELSIHPKALLSRIERGWSIERALTQRPRVQAG